MKFLKVFLLSVCWMLIVHASFAQLPIQSAIVHPNESGIQSSPLSDDQTDPIKGNALVYTEFIITRDESRSLLSNFKTISFFSFILSFISFEIVDSLFLFKRVLTFPFLKSSQSFLQVFRL